MSELYYLCDPEGEIHDRRLWDEQPPEHPTGYLWLRVVDDPPPFDAAGQVRTAGSPTIADGEYRLGYQVEDIPLADLAATRRAGIAAARWAYVQAGTVTVAGVQIRTDDNSRAEIEALHGVLADGVITGTRFKPALGAPVAVDLAAVAAIRTAVTLFYQAARTHEADLIDLLDAALAAEDRDGVLAVTWSAPS